MRNADERCQSTQTFDNRLMRRYALPTLVELEWLAGRRRKGIRRRVEVPTAQVLDLSMGGMLVEAPAKPRLEVNDVVEIASDGNRATARIAHKHVAIDPDKQLLGIEFLRMSEAFEASLHALVRLLRG